MAEELNKIEVASMDAALGILSQARCYCYSVCAEDADGCNNAIRDFLDWKMRFPQSRRHPSMTVEVNPLTIMISPWSKGGEISHR